MMIPISLKKNNHEAATPYRFTHVNLHCQWHGADEIASG